METIQGQSTFFRKNTFFSTGGSICHTTRNQPSCSGGVKRVHFYKDPNNPWQPIRSHCCIKEILKYECRRWKIVLLTNWKCLLEVRIILWKPLWVLEDLQSVRLGHCAQCCYSNMPWDFSSVCLVEQVARFSTELWAPGGQGPCLIHLVSRAQYPAPQRQSINIEWKNLYIQGHTAWSPRTKYLHSHQFYPIAMVSFSSE